MFSKRMAFAILFVIAAGVATHGPWREAVSPPSAMVLRDLTTETHAMSDKAAAATMALEGLEMGFRVLGARLNEAMAKSKRKVRLECDPLQPGDSMAEARHMLKKGLEDLPLEILREHVHLLCPWTLGAMTMDVALEEKHPSGLDHSIAFLLDVAETEKWHAPEWRERVIDPVEKHYKGMREWIKSKCPSLAMSDDTRTAMELCKAWCHVHPDRGGPTDSQAAYLDAMIHLGGNAIAEDIATHLGEQWANARNSAHGRAARINARASSEKWEVAEVNAAFQIRLKASG